MRPGGWKRVDYISSLKSTADIGVIFLCCPRWCVDSRILRTDRTGIHRKTPGLRSDFQPILAQNPLDPHRGPQSMGRRTVAEVNGPSSGGR
jgi:hypothetical protein